MSDDIATQLRAALDEQERALAAWLAHDDGRADHEQNAELQQTAAALLFRDPAIARMMIDAHRAILDEVAEARDLLARERDQWNDGWYHAHELAMLRLADGYGIHSDTSVPEQ